MYHPSNLQYSPSTNKKEVEPKAYTIRISISIVFHKLMCSMLWNATAFYFLFVCYLFFGCMHQNIRRERQHQQELETKSSTIKKKWIFILFGCLKFEIIQRKNKTNKRTAVKNDYFKLYGISDAYGIERNELERKRGKQIKFNGSNEKWIERMNGIKHKK